MTNSLSNILNLKKQYKVKSDSATAFSRLNLASENSRSFNCKIDDKDQKAFTVSAKTSLGVLVSAELNLGAKHISIYGHLEQNDSNNSTLSLSTKVRFEIILLSLISIPVYIIMLINLGSFPYWLFLLPILLVSWFFMIYRYQEKILVKKVEGILNAEIIAK